MTPKPEAPRGGENQKGSSEVNGKKVEVEMDPEKERRLGVISRLAKVVMGSPREVDKGRNADTSKNYVELTEKEASEKGYEIPDIDLESLPAEEKRLVYVVMPEVAKLVEADGVVGIHAATKIFVDYIWSQNEGENRINVALNVDRFEVLAKVAIIFSLLNKHVKEGANVDTTPERTPKKDLAGWMKEVLSGYQSLVGMEESDVVIDGPHILAELQSSGYDVPNTWAECDEKTKQIISQEIKKFAQANRGVTYQITAVGPTIKFPSED